MLKASYPEQIREELSAMSSRIRSDPESNFSAARDLVVALYLVGFITLRLTGVIRSYILQFPGYNSSYLLQTDS